MGVMTPHHSRVGRTVTALVAGALLVTACGSSGDDTADAEEPAAAESEEPSEDGAESGEDAAVEVDIAENRPVVVTGAALSPYDSTIPDDAVGSPSPIVDGQAFDGTSITLGGAADGPRLVVFLAHWCPHCNDEIPELIELDESGRLPADLEVIGVSTGVQQGQPNYPPSAWMAEKGWPWPVLADDEESTALLAHGATGFPFSVLLDADGDVLARTSGSAPADAIEAWLADNLA